MRCSVARKVPTADVPVTWFFSGVTDWPAKDIPYRAMEMRGAPYLNVLVKSVNQPIPESYFRFPMQELLTAGLPVRRISSGITDETSQITSLMVANAFIRRALTGQDPENAKQAIQKFCQSLNSETGKQKLQQALGETLQEYKKRSEDPQTWEKILSAVTEEQWESMRLANYPDLSSEEFAKKKTNSEFRKQLAASYRD